jgi:hypothetical protein
MVANKRKYFLPIILFTLGIVPSLTAQYLTDSINYEDHSKFAEDLYWITIWVNPLAHSVPPFTSQAKARNLLVSVFVTPNTPSAGL